MRETEVGSAVRTYHVDLDFDVPDDGPWQETEAEGRVTISILEDRPDNIKEAIYDLLRREGPLWPTAIAKRLHLNIKTVSKYLYALVQEGRVIKKPAVARAGRRAWWVVVYMVRT